MKKTIAIPLLLLLSCRAALLAQYNQGIPQDPQLFGIQMGSQERPTSWSYC